MWQEHILSPIYTHAHTSWALWLLVLSYSLNKYDPLTYCKLSSQVSNVVPCSTVWYSLHFPFIYQGIQSMIGWTQCSFLPVQIMSLCKILSKEGLQLQTSVGTNMAKKKTLRVSSSCKSKIFQIIPPREKHQCGSHAAGMYSKTWGWFAYIWNIRMSNNWTNMWTNTRGSQSRDSPLLLCWTGNKHTQSNDGRKLWRLELWERWGTNEETLRLSHFLSPILSLLSLPPHAPQPLNLLSSHAEELFLLSPALSTPSVPQLCHPPLFFFFCPSHPLVLTPVLSPLKSPGNKLWCLSSSLLSRSPHPSSPSGDTSAVKVGSVQKAQPLRSVQYKPVSLQRSSALPYSLSFSFPSLFCCSSPLCTVCYAHSGSSVPEKPTQLTHMYACTYTVTDTQLGPSCIQRLGFGNQWRRKKKRGKEFK